MADASEPRTDGTAPPRAPLTRDAVIAEALALIDDEGLDKLSMRRLAGRLGVEAMSLYNHVSDKSDLLSGVADGVLAEMEPSPTGKWKKRVRWVLGEFRRVCLAHPAAVPLVVATGFTTPAAMRPIDELLGALESAGLDAADRVRAFRLLIAYAIGSISCELADRANATPTSPADAAADPSSTAALPTVQPTGFPHLAEIGELLSACDYDSDFPDGLDVLLGAIAN